MLDLTTLELDTTVRIKGEKGVFRYKGVNPKDGSAYLWGGLSGKERNRSVIADRLELQKRKRRVQ